MKKQLAVLVLFFLMMSFGYGTLATFQVEPPFSWRLLLSFSGLVLANLIVKEWTKAKR